MGCPHTAAHAHAGGRAMVARSGCVVPPAFGCGAGPDGDTIRAPPLKLRKHVPARIV